MTWTSEAKRKRVRRKSQGTWHPGFRVLGVPGFRGLGLRGLGFRVQEFRGLVFRVFGCVSRVLQGFRALGL